MLREKSIASADAANARAGTAQRELLAAIAEIDLIGAWEGQGAPDVATGSRSATGSATGRPADGALHRAPSPAVVAPWRQDRAFQPPAHLLVPPQARCKSTGGGCEDEQTARSGGSDPTGSGTERDRRWRRLGDRRRAEAEM